MVWTKESRKSTTRTLPIALLVLGVSGRRRGLVVLGGEAGVLAVDTGCTGGSVCGVVIAALLVLDGGAADVDVAPRHHGPDRREDREPQQGEDARGQRQGTDDLTRQAPGEAVPDPSVHVRPPRRSLRRAGPRSGRVRRSPRAGSRRRTVRSCPTRGGRGTVSASSPRRQPRRRARRALRP